MAAEPAPALLDVRGLTAGFGAGPVLFGVDLDLRPGEMVALIGANGAGKSTLLGVLSGLLLASGGHGMFDGPEITHARPGQIVAPGPVHVPQGRRPLAPPSVGPNPRPGAYL